MKINDINKGRGRWEGAEVLIERLMTISTCFYLLTTFQKKQHYISTIAFT